MAIDTSFSDIDLNAEISKPTLLLCRPSDQKSIANMSPHAFNVKMKVSLGNISELSFSLPYDIEINHKLARLPYIDSVRDRYYIKVIYNKRTEIFIITDIDNSMDDNGAIKHIKAYSLAYSLHDKLINSYEVTSYTLEEVVNDVLGMTTWTYYWIDPLFNQRYRSFSITSEMSVLDFLVEVAETFGAILHFDTVNKQISFYKPESLEFDKGLFIKPGRYLQSLNQNISTQDVCTHLRIVGKDGLTINRLTPTGSGELVDYTTFLYPYEEDELGNVVNHSYYFSDGLAKSIIKYNNLLESKSGEFDLLLTQLDTLQSEMITLTNELSTLQTELQILYDTLDVGNATGQDVTDIIIEKNNKESEIATKETEIANKQIEIDDIYSQIATLRDEVSEVNNFTEEELLEKNELTIVRYYYNQYCDDDEQLYQLGIEYFDKIKSPQIVQSLSITNFLSVVDCQRDWDKIGLGYIVRLHVEKFGIDVKLKITDIEYDFDNTDSINITISNVVNYLSDKEKFIKELYKKSISTSTTVELNKSKFNTINDVTSDFYQYMTSELDTAHQKVLAGVNNSVEVSRRGVLITDPTDPLKKIHITAGVIGLSLDGGNTFQTAILPDGIIAQRLVGQILLGETLTISNESGTFTFNKDGLTISQNAISIDGGLSDDQIQNATNWNNAADKIDEVSMYLTFDETGLNIGKTDSPLNITISNEQINFVDSGAIVAYINGQKMYIDSLEVLSSLVVGNHKIEKFNNEITLIKWVG